MNSVEEFFNRVITVKLPDDRESVDIIDQTLLPNEIKRINVSTKEAMWDAIKKLRVRGAPAIGVFAAMSMAVLASEYSENDYDSFRKHYREDSDYLATSRPTAVNLFWALNRMSSKLDTLSDKSIGVIKDALFDEALAIQEEDIQISRNIGEIGFGLLQDLKQDGEPLGIETHCNAGTLATAKYGTMAGPEAICMCTVMRQGHFYREPDSLHSSYRMPELRQLSTATIWHQFS